MPKIHHVLFHRSTPRKWLAKNGGFFLIDKNKIKKKSFLMLLSTYRRSAAFAIHIFSKPKFQHSNQRNTILQRFGKLFSTQNEWNQRNQLHIALRMCSTSTENNGPHKKKNELDHPIPSIMTACELLSRRCKSMNFLELAESVRNLNTRLAQQEHSAIQELFELTKSSQTLQSLSETKTLFQALIKSVSSKNNTNEVLARQLIQHMWSVGVSPDVVCYSMLLRLFTHKSKADLISMKNVFEEMEAKNIEPNIIIYNLLLLGFKKQHPPHAAGCLLVMKRLKNAGIKPTISTYTTILSTLLEQKNIDTRECINVIQDMTRNNIRINEYFFNVIMNMMTKNTSQNITACQIILNLMESCSVTPGLRTYAHFANATIYSSNKDLKRYSRLIHDMNKRGVNPNILFFIKSMEKLSQMRPITLADIESFINLIQSSETALDINFFEKTMELLAKNNEATTEQSLQLLQKIENFDLKPNIDIFSSLIHGLCKKDPSRISQWLELFDHIDRLDLKVNSSLFNPILHAANIEKQDPGLISTLIVLTKKYQKCINLDQYSILMEIVAKSAHPNINTCRILWERIFHNGLQPNASSCKWYIYAISKQYNPRTLDINMVVNYMKKVDIVQDTDILELLKSIYQRMQIE